MKTQHLAWSYGAAMAMAALLCDMASAQTAAVANGGNTTTPATHGVTGVPGDKYDPTTTQAFIDQAAYSNRAEIAEARYITEHTKSPAVTDFAKKMIDDHSAALHDLEQIASSDGFVMPSGIDKKDRAAMTKLKQERGARLNMAYSIDEESDHKEAVAKFEQASQNSSIAPALRLYAAKTLPTLKEHLRMVQQLVATQSRRNPAG